MSCVINAVIQRGLRTAHVWFAAGPQLGVQVPCTMRPTCTEQICLLEVVSKCCVCSCRWTGLAWHWTRGQGCGPWPCSTWLCCICLLCCSIGADAAPGLGMHC